MRCVRTSALGDQGPIGSFQVTKTDQIHRATGIDQPSHPAIPSRCSNFPGVLRLPDNTMSPYTPRVRVDVIIVVQEYLSVNSRSPYQSTLNFPSDLLARRELDRIRVAVSSLPTATNNPTRVVIFNGKTNTSGRSGILTFRGSLSGPC